MLKNSFKIILLGLAGLILTGGLFLLFLSRSLPNPADFPERKIAQSTKIYDRTGKIILYEIYDEVKRTIISGEEIPEVVKKTTLAAEDSRFFQHSGFDWRGILRAFYYNFKNPGQFHGGSTLTQQLARNAFLTSEKTINRKIKEAILTIGIEQIYSKNEILELYLNQISYGQNAYGIEAASQIYFNKPAKELTLAEAAYLAALIKAPGRLSPYGSRYEELVIRKNWILNRVEKLKFFSPEEIQKAKEEKVKFAPFSPRIKAPHFVMYLRDYLHQKYGEDELIAGGYKIISTLDMRLQTIAEDLVKKYGEINEKKIGVQNLALLSQDPKTGQILAMVGSRDFWNKEIDGQVNVTTKTRQPGSAFKPFVYAAAFQKGFTDKTIVYDLTTNFSLNPLTPYIPQNYDGKVRGPVTFRQALAQSLNISSVKILYLAGIKESISLAQSMGITTLYEPPEHYGLALVLGGGGVKLSEMINAYAVFGQNGIFRPQTAILRIENNKGKVLEEYKPQEKQVLDPQIARLISDILSDNESRAPTFGWNSPLYFSKIKVAVKTGTDAEYRDAYTIGYTPTLAVGVWAGNNDRSPVAPTGAPGIMLAAPCWREFMEKSFVYYPPEDFIPPYLPEIKRPMFDGNYIVQRKFKNTLTNEEKIFKEIHSLLFYVNKNDVLGPKPLNPSLDPQFLNWESSVLTWAKNNIANFDTEYNQFIPPEYQELDYQTETEIIIPEETTRIEIISPKNGDFVSGNFVLQLKIENPLDIRRLSIFLNQQLLANLPLSEKEYYTFPVSFQELALQNELKAEVENNAGQIFSKTIIVFR